MFVLFVFFEIIRVVHKKITFCHIVECHHTFFFHTKGNIGLLTACTIVCGTTRIHLMLCLCLYMWINLHLHRQAYQHPRLSQKNHSETRRHLLDTYLGYRIAQSEHHALFLTNRYRFHILNSAEDGTEI